MEDFDYDLEIGERVQLADGGQFGIVEAIDAENEEVTLLLENGERITTYVGHLAEKAASDEPIHRPAVRAGHIYRFTLVRKGDAVYGRVAEVNAEESWIKIITDDRGTLKLAFSAIVEIEDISKL
jgi:preprotein translocase subunit YajC